MLAYEVLFTLREDADCTLYRTIYQTWNEHQLQRRLDEEFGFERAHIHDWRIKT